MKKVSFFIILALLLFPLISSPLLATTRGISVVSKHGQNLYLYKDYHALVIGISNYEKWPRLPNAVNDAKEVAAKLKEFGFEVRLVLDPTSREIKTVLSEMVYKMGREENRALLFYYAGHGETETLADKTKMGYIIPRDCPLLGKDPMGFTTHAISMRDIESVSMRIRAKHVVMLFDSCFSGSLFALVRAAPDDITEKSLHPVRQYITAGREDEQVPDKSMFKRCFLIGLDGDADLTGDGYITGSELGMYLSDKVINYTHRRQHPQYGKINNPDLDRGDFIFALKAPPKEKEPAAVAPPQPPKVLEKSQDDLDQFLVKIKEKKEAKKKVKDALVRNFKRLLKDLEKYKKIESSDLDEETKLAAWGVLSEKYPQWSDGVEAGDSDSLVNRALASDIGGSLSKLAKVRKGVVDAPAPAEVSKTQFQPKLAIFPSILMQMQTIALDDISMINTAVDALSQVKTDTNSVFPIYSYYDLGNKHKTINISQNIMTDAVVDDLWIRKSLFSNKEPNVDLVCQLGKRLQVDAILMYSIYDTSDDDEVEVFLINPTTRKKYHSKDRSNFSAKSDLLLSVLKSLTEKVFTDYESEKLK